MTALPSAAAAPEVAPTFARRPDAALAAFRERGVHVEPAVWDVARCEELRRLSQMLAPFRDGTMAPANHPHRELAAVHAAFCCPTIVGIAEQLVGSRVVGLQTQLLFGAPGRPGFAVHQDNFFIQGGEALATAWVALEDATPENGCLFVYPGSHRLPILPVEEVPNVRLHPGQAPTGQRLRVTPPAGFAQTAVAVRAGSAVFMHGNLLHGAYDNRSLRFRMAVLMTYLREGAPFRAGDAAGRVATDVHPQASAPSGR